MRKSNGGAARACSPSRSRSTAKPGRIIVAGSDAEQRTELRIVMELEGHRVMEATDADQLLEMARGGSHRVLILASRSGEMNPYALCRRIRLESDLGIIVLAADDTAQGRIDLWNAGADDYLASPFVYRELQARVRALLRRVTRIEAEGPEIVLPHCAIDLQTRQIKGPGGRVSSLTPKEFLVLEFLAAHANMAFTCRNLAQSAWQEEGAGKAEYLRLVIRQLRRKLEPNPDQPRYIISERSAGYRFNLPQGSWEQPVQSA